jgi:hypothetical protein
MLRNAQKKTAAARMHRYLGDISSSLMDAISCVTSACETKESGNWPGKRARNEGLSSEGGFLKVPSWLVGSYG